MTAIHPQRLACAFFAICLAMLLAACGGSGGGGGGTTSNNGNPPPGDTGGIEGTGRSIVGVIDGFGSVIINGIRFETTSATITVGGLPATQADLDVGDVVVLFGTVDDDGLSGEAETIDSSPVINGPVTIVQIDDETLIVVGQTVIVDDDTIFDDDTIVTGDLDGIDVDDVVEIHGLPLADGTIVATRIEIDVDDDDIEVTGEVKNADAGAQTFELNGLTVDYSAATLSGFPGGRDPEDGDIVEVEGPVSGFDADAGTLAATEVELEDLFDDADEGDELEIEGFITAFNDATDFSVGPVRVTTDVGTEYENGTVDDLAEGVRIEVEGELDASGVLVADEIEFVVESDSFVAGNVDSIGTNGEMVVFGVTVRTDTSTQFEDESDVDDPDFGFDDLRVGDYVEVRGTEEDGGSNVLIASGVERDDDSAETEIAGVVDAVTPTTTLEILGVTVDTTEAECQFDDVSDDCDAFFEAIVVGSTIVEAEGTANGAVLIADEVEIDD